MSIKEVKIGEKVYKLRRITLRERREIAEKSKDSKGDMDMNAYQAWMIFYSVAEPKFQSIDEVYNLPAAEADDLLLEANALNMPSPDFLSKLKSFSELAKQVSQLTS